MEIECDNCKNIMKYDKKFDMLICKVCGNSFRLRRKKYA